MQQNDFLRNVAIIAHVDHGKTTLVDALFKQSGVFRADQRVDDRVMDKMDLERERGITIAAKNCAVRWKGVKINIIDTPGHADFGGEVERSLSMASGAILLVDSSEGPLPQTRFVLRKTLEAGLPVVVVINKIDRKDARPQEVLNEIYDLFIDLGASEDQLEFPVLYAIGRAGVAMNNVDDPQENLSPLLETILTRLPGPSYDPEQPFQMLVADLDYSDYLGRLAVGRIMHGKVFAKESLVCIGEDGAARSLRATRLQVYDGLQLSEVEEAQPGDIVVLAGIEDVTIGDTICTRESPCALPRIRVEETADRDAFLVKGRGEFQMAILIETMRREGFELSVGRPEVILKKDASGKTLEPIEHLYVDCDEIFMGVVTDKLAQHKGRMLNCTNNGTGRVRLEFSVPSRGLIGYRDEFLTDTRGTGIMNSYLEGYGEWRGDFPTRFSGSIVADRPGVGVAYALFNLEPRGTLFVEPGDPVYEGMIVGEHNRDNDIDVNATKEKKLTNLRAAGKDENVILTPVKKMTLEHALHFVREDELVEVTPQSIRLRKAELSSLRRYQIAGKAAKNNA